MAIPSALSGGSEEPADGTSRPGAAQRVHHLVMWAADTDHLVDDLFAVDMSLRPVTQALAGCEGIVWATHDLDRESVCFSLMVEGWARGSDDGLAAARLRARTCLRRCLVAAGMIDAGRSGGKAVVPPVRLRLDHTPLSLRAVQVVVPSGEAMN